MIAGHPALRLLARRKFIGALRKQGRKLKTLKGALLAAVGLGAIVLWFGSILKSSMRMHVSPEAARLGGAVFTLMSLVGALSFRGLYLPREEIELLFAAPISRADVIRYRLWTSLGKSLFGSFFSALVITGRGVSVPAYGFIGTFLAMMTLPLAAQIVSLFAGDVENRWFQKIPRGVLRAANIAGVMVIVAILFLPSGRTGMGAGSLGAQMRGIPELPLVKTLTLPFWPWATLITATSARQFFGVLPLCLFAWWVLYEACVRVPIDYRELSLETSADVARRLSRLRRGGTGAAGGKAAASSAGWQVPWLFGRGPFGALAWRKTGSILRKARGTLMISGAMVGLLVLATWKLFREDTALGATFSSAVIGAAGTIYLCAGLRFDFREDLERMDVVRSWPIGGWRVFLALILPEVVLVAGLLMLAIVVRVAVAQTFPIEVLGILAVLPPTVLGWVAIDNTVFLVWPVRITPGDEGMLQQAGRSLVLMLLRMVSVAVFGGLVFGVVALAWLAREWLDYPDTAAKALGALAGLTVMAAECAFLVHLGGRALERFDVARDR